MSSLSQAVANVELKVDIRTRDLFLHEKEQGLLNKTHIYYVIGMFPDLVAEGSTAGDAVLYFNPKKQIWDEFYSSDELADFAKENGTEI